MQHWTSNTASLGWPQPVFIQILSDLDSEGMAINPATPGQLTPKGKVSGQ